MARIDAIAREERILMGRELVNVWCPGGVFIVTKNKHCGALTKKKH